MNTNFKPDSYSSFIELYSEEIVKYLCKYHGKIVSCEIEWFQNSENAYSLLDIINISEGVTLAGKNILRNVVEAKPLLKILSRPTTARSNNKSFRFTPNLHPDASKVWNESYTTPKSFRLSYEFKPKMTQTGPVLCCDKFSDLEYCEAELKKLIDKKQFLEGKLERIREKNEKKLEEIDKVWKNKCVELSAMMADKMYEEKRKYEAKIKALQSSEKVYNK